MAQPDSRRVGIRDPELLIRTAKQLNPEIRVLCGPPICVNRRRCAMLEPTVSSPAKAKLRRHDRVCPCQFGSFAGTDRARASPRALAPLRCESAQTRQRECDYGKLVPKRDRNWPKSNPLMTPSPLRSEVTQIVRIAGAVPKAFLKKPKSRPLTIASPLTSPYNRNSPWASENV